MAKDNFKTDFLLRAKFSQWLILGIERSDEANLNWLGTKAF